MLTNSSFAKMTDATQIDWNIRCKRSRLCSFVASRSRSSGVRCSTDIVKDRSLFCSGNAFILLKHGHVVIWKLRAFEIQYHKRARELCEIDSYLFAVGKTA